MQSVSGLLSLVYIGIVGWLGYEHHPIWIQLVAAPVGCLLYMGFRPRAVILFQRDGFVQASLTIYFTQVITAAMLFGLGWTIGAIVD